MQEMCELLDCNIEIIIHDCYKTNKDISTLMKRLTDASRSVIVKTQKGNRKRLARTMTLLCYNVTAVIIAGNGGLFSAFEYLITQTDKGNNEYTKLD